MPGDKQTSRGDRDANGSRERRVSALKDLVAERGYDVPADNPFVGQAGILPEIYAWGFRNPYSFGFDSQTGDLYLGDVGQNDVEEIDRISRRMRSSGVVGRCGTSAR